ncbi:FAD-dependent oxidoreductase [Blastomonas sp.]|uniref:FAD-dependent oxidoreductase n=1 Tax=Blastomonas sp. TaxID=1909299 RepID=UPI00260A0E96|nr:FAD-dependent oxidoreductase [Blastomonas sp.]MDM7954956.1 FAD-dependent oxidoreductase [Blastomonas sp.]
MDLQLDRRALVSGGAALALSGCTTMPSGSPPRLASVGSSSATASCLARVNVDPSRVIRTVAGLRPYRPSGFVVRAEAFGDALLVHNYGHGGGGISLSWGSSRLATALGLPGHSGPVAVIGSGIMGLTTARLVQEAGYPVTIYTDTLPPGTTSNIAGGQIYPAGHFDDAMVTPQWRDQAAAAADYSRRRFQIMVGEDYGVRWLPTYDQTRRTGAIPPDLMFPGRARLAADQHPFPLDNVVRYETMYVETGRFMERLLRDIRIAGGRIEVRRFQSPYDVAALPERLVFNCTGLGAAALFGDTELVPVRGQLAVLIPQPEVDYAYALSAGYMFPRSDGILLGGTFERGEYTAEPQPQDIADIVESHRRLMAGWRCA